MGGLDGPDRGLSGCPLARALCPARQRQPLDRQSADLTQHLERGRVDRSAVLADWVPVIRGMVDNGVYTYAYFNNHFAGYAPESLEMFRRLWSEGAR